MKVKTPLKRIIKPLLNLWWSKHYDDYGVNVWYCDERFACIGLDEAYRGLFLENRSVEEENKMTSTRWVVETNTTQSGDWKQIGRYTDSKNACAIADQFADANGWDTRVVRVDREVIHTGKNTLEHADTDE